MGKIGYGYGSEWHLLRWLGRHRAKLSSEIEKVVGSPVKEWLDFEFNTKADSDILNQDSELKGLGFLAGKLPDVVQEWKTIWPHTGNVHNWDAVAYLESGHLLLVEAKAHLREVASDSDSHGGEQRQAISDLIEKALRRWNIKVEPSTWLGAYYQYANRLILLDFLQSRGIGSKLLFLYFTGNQSRGMVNPENEKGWEAVLSAQEQELGLWGEFPHRAHVHKLFLPVRMQN